MKPRRSDSGAADAQLSSLAGAIDRALFYSYRDNAKVIFMMVCPNEPTDAERLRQLAPQLAQREIEAVVFTDSRHKEKYNDLAASGRVLAFNEDTAERPAAGLTSNGPKPSTASPTESGSEADDNRELVVTARSVDDLLARLSFDSNKSDVDSAIGLIGRYRRRTLPERYRWIEDFGGSRESEDTVALGLNWLARHQDKAGRWSRECLTDGEHRKCEEGPLCRGPGQMASMAHTGLAVLAFQAGGNFDFATQKYSEAVRKGLDWICWNQRPDGMLIDPNEDNPQDHSAIYEHGIATFALCEACAVAKAAGVKPQPRYLAAARRAVDYIVKVQRNDGGWRYTFAPTEPSDTSVTGWQVLALKSAKEAGIEFPQSVLDGAERFFRACELGGGRWRYGEGPTPTEAPTGIGMLFHLLVLDQPDMELLKLSSKHLAQHAEARWRSSALKWQKLKESKPDGKISVSRPDFYLWYNCTLAMFHAGGDDWQRWNNVVREVLIGSQNKDTKLCTRGSWDPTSHWGSRGGRIYSTALAVLSLQVYYRYETQKKH